MIRWSVVRIDKFENESSWNNQVGICQINELLYRFNPPQKKTEKSHPMSYNVVMSPVTGSTVAGLGIWLEVTNQLVLQASWLLEHQQLSTAQQLPQRKLHPKWSDPKMWSVGFFLRKFLHSFGFRTLFRGFFTGLRLLFGCKHTLEAKANNEGVEARASLGVLRFFGKASSAPAAWV